MLPVAFYGPYQRKRPARKKDWQKVDKGDVNLHSRKVRFIITSVFRMHSVSVHCNTYPGRIAIRLMCAPNRWELEFGVDRGKDETLSGHIFQIELQYGDYRKSAFICISHMENKRLKEVQRRKAQMAKPQRKKQTGGTQTAKPQRKRQAPKPRKSGNDGTEATTQGKRKNPRRTK